MRKLPCEHEQENENDDDDPNEAAHQLSPRK